MPKVSIMFAKPTGANPGCLLWDLPQSWHCQQIVLFKEKYYFAKQYVIYSLILIEDLLYKIKQQLK